jgi:hypothetical protein
MVKGIELKVWVCNLMLGLSAAPALPTARGMMPQKRLLLKLMAIPHFIYIWILEPLQLP